MSLNDLFKDVEELSRERKNQVSLQLIGPYQTIPKKENQRKPKNLSKVTSFYIPTGYIFPYLSIS